MYYMEAGWDCEARDAESQCEWEWVNLGYLKGSMGCDAIGDAVGYVRRWRRAAELGLFQMFQR